MKRIKFFVFLLFVSLAAGELADPWGQVREKCRTINQISSSELAKTTRNDFHKIADFWLCFGRELGNVRPDGTVDVENNARTLGPIVPSVIGKPISECCTKQIYGGKIPDPQEVAIKFTDFVLCVVNKLTPEMYDLIGLLEPAKYEPAETCPAK